ncbi:uncharacterized protein B0I36DRAFT_366811 [Microdochium trichocladiopsis]|uniref:Uncharacterized protein n=1 Tax=Microdochium trichocladiopsis TaxID=1682393 RepID=A0A9P9BLY8_9PEZI|nr:uncharacterized protein B0I36DRAFT_366811 [Microdochium trichocladiopsis]KAH7024910.1 hypothetical protein B0I36DRAFT_366811 [Microdochium trichocladiopsis]
MRVALSILAGALLVPSGACFGARGAAERASYFSTYMGEEVFENAGDRKIATGCFGTRTGIRGQANRCNLIEFLNYIRDEVTDGNLALKDDVAIGDRSVNQAKYQYFPNPWNPNPPTQIWTGRDWGQMGQLEGMTPVDRAKWITDMVDQANIKKMNVMFDIPSDRHPSYAEFVRRNPGWTVGSTRKGEGNVNGVPQMRPGNNIAWQNVQNRDTILYTGNVNYQRLEGIARPAGKPSWEAMVAAWPGYQQRVNNAINSATGLDQATKDRLTGWKDTCIKSYDIVVELRKMGLDEAVHTQPRTGNHQTFSQYWAGDIITTTYNSPTGYSWRIMDSVATIQAAVDSGRFANREAAEKAFFTAWGQYTAQDSVIDHQDVFQKWRNSAAAAASCS